MDKNQAYAYIAQIIPGDDNMKLMKLYSDSKQQRAAHRRMATTVLYSRIGLPYLTNLRWVCDSKARAAFGGGGAGNAKCHWVTGFGDCRDDTISITVEDKLKIPIDWEKAACTGSWFYELVEKLEECRDVLHLHLGLENIVTNLPGCLTEMGKTPRNEEDLKEACQYIYPASRPKFNPAGASLGTLGDGQEQGRKSIMTGTNVAALKFRKALIAAVNCYEPTPTMPTPTQPNINWASPSTCVAGEKGTKWGPNGLRDGYFVGIPFAQSKGHLELVQAFEVLLKSETTLLQATSIVKSREIAFQQCVLDPAKQANAVSALKTKVDDARVLNDAAINAYTAALEQHGRHHVATVLTWSASKTTTKTWKALKKELNKIDLNVAPVSICLLRDYIKKGSAATPPCHYDTTSEALKHLLDTTDNICDLTTVEGDDVVGEWKVLWSLIEPADFSAWKEEVKDNKDKEVVGHIDRMNWFGSLDFYRPGEVGNAGPMHTLFRVGGSFATVLIKHQRYFDTGCTQTGVTTRTSIFEKTLLKTCRAVAGIGPYGGAKHIKRMSSHIFVSVVNDLDWGVGFNSEITQVAPPAGTTRPDWCTHEDGVQKGWRAISTFFRTLWYFHTHAGNAVAVFGFQDFEQSVTFLKTSTKNMFLLAEALDPHHKIYPKVGPAKDYSAFGTRSCIQMMWHLVKQYEAGINNVVFNENIPERMQRIPRRRADSTFRGTTAEGKPQPYLIMKNNEVSAMILRQVPGNGKAWAKQMQRGEARRIALYQPHTLRANVDALNALMLGGVEAVVGTGFVAPTMVEVGEGELIAERELQEDEDDEDPPEPDQQEEEAAGEEDALEPVGEEEEGEDADVQEVCLVEEIIDGRDEDLNLGCPGGVQI